MYKFDFLQLLNEKLEGKSADEMQSLLIRLGKELPSEFYETVLSLFELEKKRVQLNDMKTEKLLIKLKELRQKIQNGDYPLYLEYYEDDEDYYDYYSPYEVQGVELVDENGLFGKLSSLLEKIMEVANTEEYAFAYKLFNEFFAISMETDLGTLTISDLFDRDVFNSSLRDTLLLYAYCAIHSKVGNDRVRSLYEILQSYGIERFNLEELLKQGMDALADEKTFLSRWTDYLKKSVAKEDGFRDALLIDVLTYSGGVVALREFAHENGLNYPEVVFHLLDLNVRVKGKLDDALFIIHKNLEKTSGINKDRVRLADYLIKIAKKTGNKEDYEKGYVEGFYSSLDLKYYIEIYSWKKSEIIQAALKYLEENKSQATEFDYYCIAFLNGEYEKVWLRCKKDSGSLGWSSHAYYGDAPSLKGRMMPLFLALLNKNGIGKITVRLLREMAEFDGSTKILTVLSASIGKLPEEKYVAYMEWCQKEIKARMDAIVGGKKRSSYDKASVLIVAMGELIILNEGKYAGLDYIRQMKSEYPRHSSFQRCVKDDLAFIGQSL